MHAIINSGPREDSTRVGAAGVVRRQAVDVSPFRRVCQAIYLIAHGVRVSSIAIVCVYLIILVWCIHLTPRIRTCSFTGT